MLMRGAEIAVFFWLGSGVAITYLSFLDSWVLKGFGGEFVAAEEIKMRQRWASIWKRRAVLLAGLQKRRRGERSSSGKGGWCCVGWGGENFLTRWTRPKKAAEEHDG